jgi:heme/copper-type cytochrome/quinol oxidase subunit 4
VTSDFIWIFRLFLDNDGVTALAFLNILGDILEFVVEFVVIVLFGAVDFSSVPGLLDSGPFLLGGFLLGLADSLALLVFLMKKVAHPGKELVASSELAFEEVNLPRLVHLVQFLHGAQDCLQLAFVDRRVFGLVREVVVVVLAPAPSLLVVGVSIHSMI